MNPNNHSVEGLDERVKAALPDDLPPEVAAGMRNRIALFRAGMTKEGKSPAARFWHFPRGLWAAIGVSMLVAGFLLQGLEIRNPLADRIALIKAAVSSSEPARPADVAPEDRAIAPEKRPVLIPDEKEARP